jgi:signal transduction histidine kinase
MKLKTKITLTVALFLAISVGLSIYVTDILPARTNTIVVILACLAVCIVPISLAVYLLNRLIARPIHNLSAAVSRIALGDLSHTIAVTSRDELGTLSKEFNEMTRQLGATHRNLQASIHTAKEGQARLASSINGLRQGFIITDDTGKPMMVNAAAMEIIRRHVKREKPTADGLGIDDIIQLLPKTFNFPTELKKVLESHNPSKFPALELQGRFLDLYLSPVLSDDQAIGCVVLLEDVTEEHILARSRDEFFSIASHELRTPLTAIRGNSSMIKQFYAEALKDADLKELVDDIHEASLRLIQIVNDFLDVSRLEQGKMQFELSAFAPEPVIEKIIRELDSTVKDKKLSLELDQGASKGKLPLVYADQSRVIQIVYNLLGNAIKFTEAEGHITIKCQHEGQNVKIAVSDTGKGISLEGQQILFHKFQQSTDSILTRDNTRGTGLGLYISKLLAENMKGTVKLEHTEVGKGSTFSLTIPVATKAQQEAQAAKAAAPVTPAAPTAAAPATASAD